MVLFRLILLMILVAYAQAATRTLEDQATAIELAKPMNHSGQVLIGSWRGQTPRAYAERNFERLVAGMPENFLREIRQEKETLGDKRYFETISIDEGQDNQGYPSILIKWSENSMTRQGIRLDKMGSAVLLDARSLGLPEKFQNRVFISCAHAFIEEEKIAAESLVGTYVRFQRPESNTWDLHPVQAIFYPHEFDPVAHANDRRGDIVFGLLSRAVHASIKPATLAREISLEDLLGQSLTLCGYGIATTRKSPQRVSDNLRRAGNIRVMEINSETHMFYSLAGLTPGFLWTQRFIDSNGKPNFLAKCHFDSKNYLEDRLSQEYPGLSEKLKDFARSAEISLTLKSDFGTLTVYQDVSNAMEGTSGASGGGVFAKDDGLVGVLASISFADADKLPVVSMTETLPPTGHLKALSKALTPPKPSFWSSYCCCSSQIIETKPLRHKGSDFTFAMPYFKRFMAKFEEALAKEEVEFFKGILSFE